MKMVYCSLPSISSIARKFDCLTGREMIGERVKEGKEAREEKEREASEIIPN
jgi:hypothetical protein